MHRKHQNRRGWLGTLVGDVEADMDFHANTPRRYRRRLKTSLCRKLLRIHAYKTGEMTAELILVGGTRRAARAGRLKRRILIPKFRTCLFKTAAEPERRDTKRTPRFLVDLDRDPRQRALARRRFEAGGGDLGEEAADRLLLRHAEHTVVIAAHADVADIGGAAGQHAAIGGRRVGVGADDERKTPVEIMAEGLFLARRLGVKIAHRDVAARPQRASRKLALDRGERIVELVHEYAPHRF